MRPRCRPGNTGHPLPPRSPGTACHDRVNHSPNNNKRDLEHGRYPSAVREPDFDGSRLIRSGDDWRIEVIETRSSGVTTTRELRIRRARVPTAAIDPRSVGILRWRLRCRHERTDRRRALSARFARGPGRDLLPDRFGEHRATATLGCNPESSARYSNAKHLHRPRPLPAITR